MKKRLSLLLVFLLFFSEIMAVSSWSWWQNMVQAPIQSISQSFDQKMVKKLFPLVALATVIGFLYWMSQKDGEDHEEPREKTKWKPYPVGINLPKAPYIEIVELLPGMLTQFPVYRQFNLGGGGAASCGYHALLRALQLVQSKSNNEPENELKQELISPDLIDFYFGSSESDWRKKIIIERKKKILKNELHKKFISVLEQGTDQKTKNLYQSALGYLETIIVGLVDDVAAGNKGYEFTDSAIKNYIRNGLDKLKNIDNASLIDTLESSIIMQQNVSFPRVREQITSGEETLRPSDLLEEIEQRSDPEKYLEGDWLDDGEIELLWHYEEEKGRSSIKPFGIICELKTVANPDYIGLEGFDEVTPFIEAQMTVHKNQPMFLVFTIGEGMKQIGDTGRTAGHWYSLVMQQDVQGNRKYYIMDSLGKDRTNDEAAKKIISKIEDFALKLV